MKFIIGVDIDSTINNLMDKTIEMYNQLYGTSYTVDDCTDYDFNQCFPVEVANNIKELFKSKDLWDSLTPVKNSQWALKKFIDNGYEIYLTTATDPINFPWKCDWVKWYFSFIPESNIIRINNKGLLNVDILIDDCAEQLISNIRCHRVCIDKPWNQSIWDEAYGIHRCSNWNEIFEVVNKIFEEECDIN